MVTHLLTALDQAELLAFIKVKEKNQKTTLQELCLDIILQNKDRFFFISLTSAIEFFLHLALDPMNGVRAICLNTFAQTYLCANTYNSRLRVRSSSYNGFLWRSTSFVFQRSGIVFSP